INSKKHFILEKIENYCIFGLGASRNEKRFDIKKFVEIAKNEIFLNNKNLKIILLGSNSEIELGKLFLNFYGDDDNKKIINLIGKTSILDIFSIIKYSKFVLGNDSAYIHIATALNIPSICLLSGHNYGSFLPYQIDENENSRTIPTCITSTKMDCFGCGVICKFGLTKNKKYVCVENIDIKKIIDGIKNLNLE
ncbi:MAG: hypothetical protein LBF97_02280, partial [Elusimicrobiota bacterium]|nr:hypothetical protein [Elusimicrobiota bacterium]